MKKSILVLGTALFLFFGSAVLTSCGNGNNSEEMDKHEHMENMENMEEVYACPMHHNITGKKGDKCSECGMDLTSTKTDKIHQGHSH